MVRLKVAKNSLTVGQIEISIPYGAIKSINIIFRNFLQKKISIPYGAIKSGHGSNNNIAKNLFQFLMVRLKVKNR